MSLWPLDPIGATAIGNHHARRRPGTHTPIYLKSRIRLHQRIERKPVERVALESLQPKPEAYRRDTAVSLGAFQ
jgi:hypothetical protein